MRDIDLFIEINPIKVTILKHLLADGRKSVTQISEESGIPKEDVNQNYKELEQRDIIRGATIHINYERFGYKAVAYLLIIANPLQADLLLELIQKIPDIYSVYKLGSGEKIRVIATLKTFGQLDKIKDTIKQKFLILEIKTIIWTDVKELHCNLTIAPQNSLKIANEEIVSQIENIKPTSQSRQKRKIDKIDLQISELLAIDGRASMTKIAQKVGISTKSAIKRYQDLKRNGIIKVTIQIDPQKLGYRALAVFFIAFTLHTDSFTVIKKVSQIPDIISIMKTSGDYDLQVYAMIRDIDQLLEIQDEFAKISGIAKMDIDITKMIDKWPTPRQYISTF